MKIIFFGTPETAASTLRALAKNRDIEILAVVTQPDRPIGRKKHLSPPPVKIVAEELNIKVIQSEKINELETELKKYQADLFVVVAYGMILSPTVLEMPKFGAINVHYSLLPKYRGASPIQESLLNGDTETGISIFQIAPKLDSGEIYFLKRVPIDPKDNTETLTHKLNEQSNLILPFILEDIVQQKLPGIPQNEANASHCHKIKKNDGKINPQMSAEKIFNMIRAFTPWPGVYMEINNKKLKILAAEYTNEKIANKFQIESKILKIATAKGTLIPTKLQIEGKKPMNTAEFLNGYRQLFS